MLVRVPTVRTNFSVADFIKSACYGWFKIYNTKPLKKNIAVIYAQWGVETGLGSSCWAYNIGNIKAIDVPGQTINYCVLQGVWEIVNGKRAHLKPEDPGSWFRAFSTLEDGMTFYMNFLRNQRYKTAWVAVEKGDPALFSHLLRQQGYYTAPEAGYTKAMQYHFNVFMNGPTFDKVMQELESLFNQVHFPADYTPLEFDVINDTVNRVEAPQLAPQGLWQRFLAFIGNK
jgi:hypothetical protein